MAKLTAQQRKCPHLNFSLTEMAVGGEFADFENGKPDAVDDKGFAVHWTGDIWPTGRFRIECRTCNAGFNYTSHNIHRARKIFREAWASFTKNDLKLFDKKPGKRPKNNLFNL